jgi:curved DNA-binding protein CbpA
MQKPSKDLYKLLEIPREASQEDIRKAHRRLVLKYHPDANPNDPTATERFKQVQQAYEVLSDENKRREYDKRFHTSSSRRESSGRARAQGRAQGRGDSRRAEEHASSSSSSSVDLSNLLGKLAGLSSDRAGGHEAGSRKLQGEDVARIAKYLGVDIPHLSKLLSENIKVNATVSFGDAQSGEFSSTDKDVSDGKSSGMSNKYKKRG